MFRAITLLRLVLAFALPACVKVTPQEPKITMKVVVRVTENAEVGKVTVNGQDRGTTPVELDALTLAFDAALQPKSWPPPGAQAFSPTVAQHGKTESSLTLAVNGDVLFVRTQASGKETLGAVRLQVKGADGSTLEFDSAEKELNSSFGKAEHSVRLYYKRRK